MNQDKALRYLQVCVIGLCTWQVIEGIVKFDPQQFAIFMLLGLVNAIMLMNNINRN
jgi:hypothetical protein